MYRCILIHNYFLIVSSYLDLDSEQLSVVELAPGAVALVVVAVASLLTRKGFVEPGSEERVFVVVADDDEAVVEEEDDDDDKRDDDDDTVLEPEPEVGPEVEVEAEVEAASEVASVSPSVSVVPTPSPSELSPAVPS